MMHDTQRPDVRRVDALDGLRALMVLAIVFYHLSLPFLPSGHLGVVVFFVLTGYLVTSGFVKSFAREKRIDQPRVLVRRFVRIWPSMAVMIIVVGILCLLFNRVLFTKLRPDVIPSALYALNWSYVFRGVSYFDAIGTPSPLLHLWYIALSEQFVLVWTLVAPFLFSRGRRFSCAVSLLLAAVSAGLMALLYVPGSDPSRVYYGLDTRMFSLLIGAALAFVWPVGRKRPISRNNNAGGTLAIFEIMGLVAFIVIVAAMVLIPAESALLYRGGMLIVSILAVAVIAGCLVPGGIYSTLLGNPALATLGTRAFAMYLWHYPIIALLDAGKLSSAWWLKLLAFALSCLAAEASYRIVEQPFGAVFNKSRNPEMQPNLGVKLLCGGVAVAAIAGSVYLGHGMLTAEDEFLVPKEALVSTGDAADKAMQVDTTQLPQDQSTSATQTQGSQEGSSSAQVSAPVTPEPEPVQIPEYINTISAPASRSQGLYDPLLIGDSVPGDAWFEETFPDAIIDTYIGRRPDQAIEVYRGYAEQGVVGSTVIFDAFSNTAPLPDQLDELVATVGSDKAIFLVGVVEPEGFMDQANENLRACADKYANVTFIDWPSICIGHETEYLYPDYTHLRPEAAALYRQMVAQAVAPYMATHGAVIA